MSIAAAAEVEAPTSNSRPTRAETARRSRRSWIDNPWQCITRVALASFLLDQATKLWARAHLHEGASETIIENILDLRLAFNSGTTFGLFSNVERVPVLLSIAAVLAVGFLVWLVHKEDGGARVSLFALGMIAGGAVGNILDRVVFAEVTDFIAVRYDQHRGPAFNLADLALFVGVLLLLTRRTRLLRR